MKYFPDDYKQKDLIFPGNDITGSHQYNLVDAKVLTNEKILLYIKKQGINLEKDECCQDNDDFVTYNAWSTTLESETDLKEIHSYSRYNKNSNILSYNFPLPRIETSDYEVHHKLWLFDKSNGSPQCEIYFNNDSSNKLTVSLSGGKAYIDLKIVYNQIDDDTFNNEITCDVCTGTIIIDMNYNIENINFKFSSLGYSPAISLHWTYYKISANNNNFSIKGKGICSYTNPCVKGYACSHGVCVKCHPSCFDCINGGLSTDCYSQCSPISTLMLPDRGSCPLAYVDLVHYEYFRVTGIIPPCRNRRLTTSFWFFLTSFPKNVSEDAPLKPRIHVSYDPDYNFTFIFTPDQLQIKFYGETSSPLTKKNTWYFVKGGKSESHSDFLFVKYFDGNDFCYSPSSTSVPIFKGDDNGSGGLSKQYLEPTDYYSMEFVDFKQLYNSEEDCQLYIKELILFREYLPDPYDNKYFSYEKLFTSTFEMPEVLFVIPFDEMFKTDDKYQIKCYTYAGSILEYDLVLTPIYQPNSNRLYYPPKLFRPLNLLTRNQKYASPDLIETDDVVRDSNTLIASYDSVPLSCIDNYFLTYEELSDYSGQYLGTCNLNCEEGTSMLHGISENKGFCNKRCGGGASDPICLSNNYDLLHLKSSFRCKTGYYESFLNCEDWNKEKNYVFKFDANQGPYNIVIDVINYKLKSYIIDFWMKPVIDADLGPYLFYTNQFYIKYNITESKAYFFTFENRIENPIDIESDGTWSHYSIEVYYDPKEKYNYKSRIYIQKNFLPNETLSTEHSENALPLEYIYFCSRRKTSCNNLDISWNRAYYKNLRLLNGNLASRHVFYRYDEYYSSDTYLLSSIKFYYPLYGHYIANNLWSQYNSKESALNTNSPTNNWNYPQYSYSKMPFETTCTDTNCKECITNDDCITCNDGFHNFKNILDPNYDLHHVECKANNKNYVLRLPTRSNFEMVPLKGLNYPAVTVDFFIKIYGFTIGGKVDVIYLGEKLKIIYESDIDSKYFGLNLVTYKEDNEIVISNYYDFRKHFGLWTFISVSVVDQTYEAFFPPMARFEINNKKMEIIGSLENLSIGAISFSQYLIALAQKVTVYKTYLIGTNSFEMFNDRNTFNSLEKYNINNYLMRPIKNDADSISFFTPVNDPGDCLFSNFGITATDKENSDIIISDYECEIDELDEIYNGYLTSRYSYFNFISEYTTEKLNCNEKCEGLCIGKYEYNCSCNFINNHMQIFLGNISNHFCKKLEYINLAKTKDIIIPNVAKGGNTFTLHFWVFAYSYIDKVFEGISIEWEYHTTIRVGLDSSGKYYFTCLINGQNTKKNVDFKMNEWNFLHCSVNYPDSKFYIASENRAYEYAFTYEKEPDELTNDKEINLIIKDLTSVKDWGVLFYRYIRIWKQELRYSSFLSRIHIINNYFSTTLLNQWDTKFTDCYKGKKYYLYETKTKALHPIEYSDEKIGANIVNEKTYQKVLDEPKLCEENGQYFDRKIWGCVNFIDISNADDDIKFKKVDVAYSHNYAMAFWILLEDHKDITNSLDFIWEYHMQISLQYSGSTFKAYCFPQNYYPYSDILNNEAISLEDKTTQVLNSAMNEYTDSLSGVWTWFECSLTYNNRYFYLNENKQNLIIETLYKEGNTEFKNDEPLGHFFNDLGYNTLSTVTLRLNKNRKQEPYNKKIYLRCFYLFKDFLPYNYDFKYMDMSQILTSQFPPLTLAVNFASFEFKKDGTGKILPNIDLSYSKYTSLGNVLSTENNPIGFYADMEFALASNFVFLPLCNPISKEKFNFETSLCEEITSCDETELKALYCMGEATPLICRDNYYININSDGTVECLNYCKNDKYFRSPGTHISTGICGTECLSSDVLKTCPNSASAILTYESDFECKQGYNRIGYQCLSEANSVNPNEGALFYSGINYPYNIFHEVEIKNNLNGKYVLEFWFMIDHVIYTNFRDNKVYYFYAFGHEVYLQKLSNGGIEYHYKYGSTDVVNLNDLLSKYEWNKFLIFVNEEKKTIKLVINFNKKESIDLYDIVVQNNNYIKFCSNQRGDRLYYPNCNTNITWASAYYNNIRLWNAEISTIDTIQSFVNKIYSEYPHSLVLFYPLTIKYLDNNQMTNIMKDEDHITLTLDKNSHMNNKDNIIIYNYSTKFDWGLLHKKKFVYEMTDNISIDPNNLNNKCNEHCTRCLKTDDIKECYECEEGYVLQYKECKDARKLYFLKTPSGTSGASIIFKTKNKDGKDFLSLTSFTIVFWMKFFGVKYGTTTENSKIMSIDANTYLAYQLSTNNLVMMENSKTMFEDSKFIDYFGIWIPISIANYISNANNGVYPNMFTLSVNKKDIPFKTGYTLPESGIKITEFSLGYEIIALFAELSIYSKFIQGGYGRIRSLQNLKDQFFYKSLTGTKPNDCLVVEDDLSSDSLICAPDYSVNFIDSYYCKNDQKYYDPYDSENNEKSDSEKCGDCNSICNTLCFNSDEESCTCDLTDGIFWLRRNSGMQTYCEHIYYLDFSNIDPYTFYDAPLTKTQEYTIEFWVFIYSYNLETSNFKELYLEWNYHNKITLFDENNSLKVNCQPIWRSHDFSTSIYSDIRSNTLKYYSWNYVRCGTDLKNRKYFSNTNIEYDLKAKKDTFFDFDVLNSESTSSSLKYFKIYRSDNFLNNFGFVFLKEIKLWQQYNLDFLDTKNIYFDMTQISKEQLKKNFPGLLLYYQNDFNLTDNGNSVIKEQMTGKIAILPRSPDYIGYNIVDPKNEGDVRVQKLTEVCPYGHVYNNNKYQCECVDEVNFLEIEDDDGNKICMVNSDQERDALCEEYSNKARQCLTCKENNQYLNKWTTEFPLDCYNKCPPTLFEDPLINQCRKCHSTCYECTNEYYNNCTSCTGVLYFNFKENTCIPNCQTAELTRSLTKPNICVVFDAGAELVNYQEDIPIDVNNFFYIEAKVVQPTSSEYETLWLFDVEKTNSINEELGLYDDIKNSGEHPFISDRTKLNVTLDHTFFKTEHKYVFGLKIYAENKGLEVPVYVYWTLTMNSAPYGGRVTTMPSIGLYNTTTFIIRCEDYEDENTPKEELLYDFYYIEQNTNMKIKLSKDFSTENEVYSNFTVRFYQLEYSNISIFCVVKDKWGATSQSESVITIVNNKHSELYNLKQIVSSFHINEEELTDKQILARSEVLMSLGINPYSDRMPETYYTAYENSITGEKVIKTEPQCVNGYCNDNGDCEVIDIALTCKCNPTHIGKQCFLDKNGYSDLASWYQKMFRRIMDKLDNNLIYGLGLNDQLFLAVYKLFFSSQNFYQNVSFFEYDLNEFRRYLKRENNYIVQNLDKINKIIDLDVFYLNYFYFKETQTKLTKKMNEGYKFRNKTLTKEESLEYKNYIENYFKMIDEDTSYIIQKYQNDYRYTSKYFNYYLININENFNDEQFFESLKTVIISYKPTIKFMECLKEKSPSSFNYYLNYIEYLVNPLSFDNNFYPNITSPYFTLKIYDENGEEINIEDCNSLIKINMPFNSYDWLNYINEQKWLFLPENYKLEDDPVFRDPILINNDGSISDDTVEERIKKYYRYYNIVGLVYTPNKLNLYEYTTVLFKNITDAFFLIFETNHLSGFSSMLIPNPMKFIVDGRFFYLPRYMVLLYLQNHLTNPVFYINFILFMAFLILFLVFKCRDFNYFDELENLDFLIKEIYKNNFGYDQIDPGKNDENIYEIIHNINKELNLNNKKEIRDMFEPYEFDDIKEEDNENDLNQSEEGKNNLNNKHDIYNMNTTTGRKFMALSKETNVNNIDFDVGSDKQTEIKTNRKRKSNKKRISHKNNNKYNNPPKRKKNKSEEDDNSKMETININLPNKRKSEFSMNNLNNTKANKTYFQNNRYNDFKGYDDEEEDFDEDKLEQILSSEKSSNKNKGDEPRAVGFTQLTQNYDLSTVNSKLGFKESKYSKFSKLSSQSKKSYFADKDNTRPNQYISIEKFHNKSYKLKMNKNFINYEEENKKALDEYTRLNVSTFKFFNYNLKTRHILLSPFLNLTLYHNRWKKLILLLTQFFLYQISLSIILTSDENILLKNISKMLIASLLSVIFSNILIHSMIPFFYISFFERKKLYRLAEKGETLYVSKIWKNIVRRMNIKIIFALIIAAIFWIINFYITFGFTSVWKVQRSTFILCFIFCILIDLVILEVLIEGICAFAFSKRKKFNLVRNIGEIINRYRCYRTLYP